jgi:glycosyltransferase involved in cell wall biosynthesis
LKVLHVITGLGDGGAEAVLYRLCQATPQVDHVVVSLRGEDKYAPMLRGLGIAVFPLNANPNRLPLFALARLWRRIHNEKPDVVQTWMYHADLLGGLAARLAGVKAVVWGIRNSDLDKATSSRATIWVTKLLARLSSLVPARIVVCAQRAKDVHTEIGYASDKMCVIPNGYDLSCFRPDFEMRAVRRAQLSLTDDAAVIGSVGRDNPQKDYSNFLKALELLKARGYRFQCLLVGTGLDSNNVGLSQLVEQHGLSGYVQLIGRQTDIAAIMNALDIHVLPSAYGEAFPNVLNEAMACGTPCVTTDVGDAAFIVGKTGWTVPKRDSAALADALAAALDGMSSAEEWQARANAARDRVVTHFSLERMADAYRVLWEELAEVPPTP